LFPARRVKSDFRKMERCWHAAAATDINDFEMYHPKFSRKARIVLVCRKTQPLPLVLVNSGVQRWHQACTQ
jgi:hypothetical protein